MLALVANRDPLSPKRIVGYLVASVVIVLAFHFLFVDILKVQLPRGTMGWW